MEIKDRKDIDDKYKFNLDAYCLNEADFYTRLGKIDKECERLADYKGKLGDVDKLFEYQKLDDELSLEMQKIYLYAELLADIDTNNVSYQKMVSSARQTYVKMSSLCSYVGEELQSLGQEKLKDIANNPKFAEYKIDFEQIIKDLPHILGEKESYILSQMGDFTDNMQIFSNLVNCEIKFDSPLDSEGVAHELSLATYSQFSRSDDRVLRENAYHSINKGLTAFKSTLFSLAYNSLKIDNFTNQLAKYNGVLETQLDSYEIPMKVFDNILDKASESTNIIKKYRSAQAKALGLTELKPWDTRVFVSTNKPKVDFETACDKMRDGFKYLGKEYSECFDRALNEKWCDVYPNKNKASYIYCADVYGCHPVMHFNWDSDASDMLTFAHEFGHSVQAVLTNSAQPFSRADMHFVVIEVPSLTSETVMFKHLLNETNDIDEKLLYYQSFIETFMANVYGGCSSADHERYLRRIIQDGGVLDVESASNEYMNIESRYSSFEKNEETKYNWLSDMHIYRAFYNYNYSLAMIIATYFGKGCYENNDKVRESFHNFMKAGDSKYPIEGLKECGVDLLDDKVYDEAFAFFNDVVDEFTHLVDVKEKQKQQKNEEAMCNK